VPIFLSIMELTPMHYGETIQLKDNQWGTVVEDIGFLDWLRFLGTTFAYTCSILFVSYSYYTARDKREKPIKLLLLVIIVLSLSLSLYQNYWVPMFSSFTVLNNESFTSFWGMLFFAWAFSDLKLFKIEPHRAVDDIISSMTNLMVLCNNYFQIKDINQAAQVFFQKNLNQLQDLPIESIIRNENWEYIKSRIYIQAEQFKKEELEITIEVDGKQRHLLLIITPFIEQNRKVGYIFIGTDLTAIEQALEKERQVAQLQNRFVSIASHQFRTPLTAIKLNTTLLKRYLKKDQEVSGKKLTRFIDRIETEVDRLTVLMNDVLTLGKLESKKMNVQMAEYDLVEIILELLDHDFSFQPDGRKMQLLVQTPPKKVMTDKKVIEHVLINLISNAFKYSPDQREPEIHVFFEKDHFKIKIIDFGIGIPQKDQSNLFKPFYRGSNTVKMQGSGLGLVIVKELISLIHGEITYESKEGQGSQFILTIKQNDV
jgi:PAS domain S-box-containing protein